MDVLKKFAKEYTEGVSNIDDKTYDELIDIINNDSAYVIDEVGDMSNSSSNKVLLPRPMKSMDKFKNKKDFENWKSNYSVLNISSKLDGISILLSGNKIYTRGNGEYGQDVSWMKDLLKIPSPPLGMMVRGELILNKDGWEIIKTENPTFTNPLSYIAGWANSKNHCEKYIKYIKFVAFTLNSDPTKYDTPSNQYVLLENNNYEVVYNKNYTNVEFEDLQKILDEYREISPYIMDGIIVSEDAPHVRDDKKNPTYAKAYKDFEENSAKVIGITWDVSRYGLLKPIVHIEPITIAGKTYKKVSGHNASFLKENLIAEGSEIIVGVNIVPIVKGVVSEAPADEVGDMIENLLAEGFSWHGKELIGSENLVKVITNFMTQLEIKGFKENSVLKVIDAGYQTLFDILSMSEEDFTKVLGKNGSKIHKQIVSNYNSVSDSKLFVASGIFQGIGLTMANTLFEKITMSDFITNKIPEKLEGFGPERYKILETMRPEFVMWFMKLPARNKTTADTSQIIDTDSPIEKIRVILTGEPPKNTYKTKTEFLNKHPELVDSGKSFKNVDLLIFGKDGIGTEKYGKARKLGLKSVTYEEYDQMQK